MDSLLETKISGKQLMVSPDSIARSLYYDHPTIHDRPYPLKAITEFDANLFTTTMCTNQVLMHEGFCAQGVHLREIKA